MSCSCTNLDEIKYLAYEDTSIVHRVRDYFACHYTLYVGSYNKGALSGVLYVYRMLMLSYTAIAILYKHLD